MPKLFRNLVIAQATSSLSMHTAYYVDTPDRMG